MRRKSNNKKSKQRVLPTLIPQPKWKIKDTNKNRITKKKTPIPIYHLCTTGWEGCRRHQIQKGSKSSNTKNPVNTSTGSTTSLVSRHYRRRQQRQPHPTSTRRLRLLPPQIQTWQQHKDSMWHAKSLEQKWTMTHTCFGVLYEVRDNAESHRKATVGLSPFLFGRYREGLVLPASRDYKIQSFACKRGISGKIFTKHSI